jgi:predicted RNase H-like HicB family nuclease
MRYPLFMSPHDPSRFPVVLSEDEAGFFNAACPIIPGCFSQGKTREEALANIREAIELSLECREQEGWELPERYELTEVAVA